jgi:hypothetical protein
MPPMPYEEQPDRAALALFVVLAAILLDRTFAAVQHN